MLPLDTIRVIDLSSGISGGYCTRLLAGAGADVVKVETGEGDPLRRWVCDGRDLGGTDGALFQYLHQGQRSILVEGGADLEALLGEADVVLCDGAGLGADPAALADAHPSLVVTAITPYGLTGPYARRPSSDLPIQADSGALAMRGHVRRPPIQVGGRIIEWVAGVYGAVGTVAACRRAASAGVGELIDVSLLEVANITATNFSDLFDSMRGRPDLTGAAPARSLETPSIEPTSDGYVGFNTNTRQQFEDFLVLIERPELIVEDESWAGVATRVARWDEWNEIVHAWTTKHTTAEVVEQAALLRIPVAPVADARTVLELDHPKERGVFVDDPTGTFRHPRRPWTIDGEPAPAPAPSPTLGQHTGSIEPHTPVAAGKAPAGERALPLAGVRVVDLTAWWAGPSATGVLASLGADVIHIESTTRLDGMRMTGGAFADRPQWWERSAFFLQANVNKRGIAVDLAKPAGRDLVLRLIEQSDLVFDNFTPRVLEQFDLDWPVVHATNPRAVMVRMPAFGLTGPWRDRPGFAQTMEQVTGLAWLTGHVDDQPRIQRGPCDPNGGMHGAFAALVALAQRDRTGVGCFVEAPMFEAALSVAAEPIIEWTAYGTLLERDGNRSPWAAPQNLYATRETEQWLALSVENDQQWQALVGVLGSPSWAADPALAHHWGRRAAHDVLDKHLAEWAAEQDLHEAVERLVAAGVPAAAARDPRRASEHPQLQAHGFYQQVDHPVAGVHPVPALPFRYRSVPQWVRNPAPTLGQHNDEVLRGMLGRTPEELADLEADNVIGTWPAGL